ncbi:DoxX family membrane protein [Bernardetia sp.]|uniref:DoxX family membrane protein n=1 Tax=Bernardetia sp. TaxID=1937974 RepID=UPI0025BD0EF1|nr:DoxX family membrane protein [Bernardetia sp.]
MQKTIEGILSIVVAIILLQTLYFKFGGAAESVWIFNQLEVEPWGRYMAGFFELVVAILILIPKTRRLGALGAILTMLGAIAAHIFVLGIVVQNDKGLLFALACITLACSVGVLIMRTIRKR